jgi:4-hydroxybutyrate dehydrogenase
VLETTIDRKRLMDLITYLTRIQFGAGALAALPEELGLLNVQKPLLITDNGVVAAGLAARVVALLPGISMFDETPANPTEGAVLAALAAYRQAGCDGIIALGGGSSIDLAKGVALLATHALPLEQYAAILGGVAKIAAGMPPVVAIPTTAGTGSEVGRAALITLTDGRKLGLISPHLIPRLALCDPALSLGLPPGLTAATGMDAISHCIETFLSPRINPPADAIALDGLARALRWLPQAVAQGSDLEARSEMMMAALQGGMCFQKGLGAVHAMSHPLGGLAAPRLHHGTLNAVIMPAVLRYNESHAVEKYARLRQAIGLAPGADVASAIDALNRSLGLPRSLSEMGVPRECLPAMIDGAVRDHSTATNPRPMQASDYEALFEAVF